MIEFMPTISIDAIIDGVKEVIFDFLETGEIEERLDSPSQLYTIAAIYTAECIVKINRKELLSITKKVMEEDNKKKEPKVRVFEDEENYKKLLNIFCDANDTSAPKGDK